MNVFLPVVVVVDVVALVDVDVADVDDVEPKTIFNKAHIKLRNNPAFYPSFPCYSISYKLFQKLLKSSENYLSSSANLSTDSLMQ